MSDFSEMASRVSRFRDDLEHQHERATEKSMRTIQREVQATLRANDSVARRVLVSDVQEGTDPTGEQMVARRVHVPGWSRYLEHGTGARAARDTQPDHEQYKAPDPLPPLDPILAWVVTKNLTSREYDSQYALAAAIARTIGEKGTFPHPFLRPVWYGTHGYRNVITQNVQGMRRALRRL